MTWKIDTKRKTSGKTLSIGVENDNPSGRVFLLIDLDTTDNGAEQADTHRSMTPADARALAALLLTAADEAGR